MPLYCPLLVRCNPFVKIKIEFSLGWNDVLFGFHNVKSKNKKNYTSLYIKRNVVTQAPINKTLKAFVILITIKTY